jgi:hypothetical protein
VTKEKVLSLAAEAAIADRRQEAVEEQCECLVHELTLLCIKGSKLCINIARAPPLTHLHEGMRFAMAQHTKDKQLSTLRAAVSLAA